MAAAAQIDRTDNASTDSVPPSKSAPAEPSGAADAVTVPAASKRVDDDIVVIGEKLIETRKDDENWSEKTQKQARQIYKLMRRFMIEEMNLDGGLTSLAQEHVAAFVNFLRKEVYKFYGRSCHDENRTIAQLRAIHIRFLADVVRQR